MSANTALLDSTCSNEIWSGRQRMQKLAGLQACFNIATQTNTRSEHLARYYVFT
jgi:hypothetical protein